MRTTVALLLLAASGIAAEPQTGASWSKIAPFFKPPAELAGEFGHYKSPLVFADGRPVKTPEQWQQQRAGDPQVVVRRHRPLAAADREAGDGNP